MTEDYAVEPRREYCECRKPLPVVTNSTQHGLTCQRCWKEVR